MLSFWEKQSFVRYDYVVIGSGIVGLSTAITLKEKLPRASVVILERGILPSGASTKNAGFACFGSLTELLSDIDRTGEAAMLSLVEERWKGLLRLRERLGDRAIDYRNYGGYELISPEQAASLQHIDRMNALLRPLFGKEVFTVDKAAIQKFGFNTAKVANMLYNRFEGQIDTGKMMKNLMGLAASLKVDILTGAHVTGFEERDREVLVRVKDSVSPEPIIFSCRKLAVCTNAFTRSLLPDLELNPGRGTVLVTTPVAGIKFRGVFHFDEGYYYFRNLGNRVLFGGGRNLDFTAEATVEFGVNESIRLDLMEKLRTMILPGQNFTVESLWSGIMAFGNTKAPVLKKLSPGIGIGVRLGGMGVAIGSRLGDRLADLLSDK